jgi:CBS domain-containing protein
MFGQSVRSVMAMEAMVTAARETTVSAAAKLMVASTVTAVLVVDHDTLAGIFTERDAVFRVIAPGRDPLTTSLADVMTPSPHTIDPERSFGHALQLMHTYRIRHVPVVEGGKLVGIVTARDAMDPEMEEFVSEARRREGIR